jgi:hypothetical protein
MRARDLKFRVVEREVRESNTKIRVLEVEVKYW